MKYKDQAQKAQFKTFHWDGPYKIVKVLTNYNYIIRQIGTPFTQCINRIRLRGYTPNEVIQGIEVPEKYYIPDPEAIADTVALDDHIPKHSQNRMEHGEQNTQKPTSTDREQGRGKRHAIYNSRIRQRG